MDRTDWDAVRAEYVAGGVAQRALAERYGVSLSALRRRCASEGWVRAREDAARRGNGVGDARARIPGGENADREAGNAEIAARLRRKLLMRLEKVADATEKEMVTELKTQDAGGTRLFKLRDLTAAYKDLAGDLAKGAESDVEDLSVLEELFE